MLAYVVKLFHKFPSDTGSEKQNKTEQSTTQHGLPVGVTSPASESTRSGCEACGFPGFVAEPL